MTNSSVLNRIKKTPDNYQSVNFPALSIDDLDKRITQLESCNQSSDCHKNVITDCFVYSKSLQNENKGHCIEFERCFYNVRNLLIDKNNSLDRQALINKYKKCYSVFRDLIHCNEFKSVILIEDFISILQSGSGQDYDDCLLLCKEICLNTLLKFEQGKRAVSYLSAVLESLDSLVVKLSLKNCQVSEQRCIDFCIEIYKTINATYPERQDLLKMIAATLHSRYKKSTQRLN